MNKNLDHRFCPKGIEIPEYPIAKMGEKTYLPLQPSEVIGSVLPTMADVDYFFENDVNTILKNGDNAKKLLAGQSLEIKVIRHLYKSWGDEILNRFLEQGWAAMWDMDGVGIQELNSHPHKRLLIWFKQKSNEPSQQEPIEIELPRTAQDEIQSLIANIRNLYILGFEQPIVEPFAKWLSWVIERVKTWHVL